MVRQCSIRKCNSESFAGCGVSFHRLPLKEVMKQKWLHAISSCLRIVKMPVVCSKHFRPEDFYQGRYPFKLREDAVPSILPVIPDTEHETLLVKMEAEEDETQFASLSETVTSVPSPKYLVQIVHGSPAVFEPMLVEVKTEADPMKTDENPPGAGDEALSFEVGPLEDLVPLSAHPVPLSTAPDPLCDFKVKVETITVPAEDATGVEKDGVLTEEDKGVGVSGGGLGGGTSVREVDPTTAVLSETRKIEKKIKDLTRYNERDRARGRNIVKAIRQRDVMIRALRERLGALSAGEGALGAGEGALVAGAGALGAGEGALDAGAGALVAGAGALGVLASQHGAERKWISEKIYNIKKNERMKKANRQLLIIERGDGQNSPDFRQNSSNKRQKSSNNRQKSSDIRKKSAQNTSGNRKKSSVQGKAKISGTSLVNVGNTSDIRQKTLVGVKPTLVIEERNPIIPRNTLVVMQPSAETSSVGTQTTRKDRQKSTVAKSKSVAQQIGSKRKSDIRQEKSSDIPQTSVGVQRTSDIRQNTLVIQIDGMQSTVIPPKLVRLKDNSKDIG